jgi:hypothetical protein
VECIVVSSDIESAIVDCGECTEEDVECCYPVKRAANVPLASTSFTREEVFSGGETFVAKLFPTF